MTDRAARVLFVLACVACARPPESASQHSAPETPAASETPPTPGVTIDPIARSACEAGLGNLQSAVTLPAGVVEDASGREGVIAAAAGWHLPDGVTFALVGSPTVVGEQVTLRGEVVNTTAAPVDVFLSEAGAGYFTATFVGEELVRRTFPPSPSSGPPRPVLFPEPHRFTLAPGAHWPIETSVTTLCWELTRPVTVKVHWWMSFEGDTRQGEVPVLLP